MAVFEQDEILINAAQQDEDILRTQQAPTPVVPTEPGVLPTELGAIAYCDGVDHTPTDDALPTEPPPVAATQDVAAPETSPAGLGGGPTLASAQSTVLTPSTAIQPPGPATTPLETLPAAGQPAEPVPSVSSADNPPTVAVVPGPPAEPLPPDITDPEEANAVINAALRQAPGIGLPQGITAELGLEGGIYSDLSRTTGSIVFGDPDGLNDVATITIQGQVFTLAQVSALSATNTLVIPLSAQPGGPVTGNLILNSFTAQPGGQNAEIGFLFQLTSAVVNTPVSTDPNISSTSALIPISVTVTDQAGIAATADGGVRILDSVPTIEAGASEPVLTVDESNAADGSQPAPGGAHSEADFAGAFISSFGADGGGSVTYQLTTVGGASGLFDVETGLAINLYLINGQVVGSTATAANLVTAGNTDFTVSVDGSGNVTLDQIQALKHGDSSNPDDSVSLADGLIGLKATITDRDGDAKDVTLNIGANLVFKDDGPSITALSYATAGAVETDETNQLNVTVTSTSAVFSGGVVTAGADGGTPDTSLLINTSATGWVTTAGSNEIVLIADGENNNIVYGKYDSDGNGSLDANAFKVQISDDGKLSVTQYVAMKHPTAGDNNEAMNLGDKLSVRIAITDGDQDPASQTLTIGQGISFRDDGPSITALSYATAGAVETDETNQLNVTVTSTSAVFSGGVVTAG
ncbi:MAG: DUF5801 repeats-in-toxin domain-containing protein, partial [Cyanobium sp.]